MTQKTPLLLWAAGLLAITTMAAAHTCIHDTPAIQEPLQHELATSEPIMLRHTPESIAAERHRRAIRPQSVSNVRFVISSSDLDDNTQYCTRAGQSVPNKQGGTAICTTDDILTTEKKDTLLNSIIPAAVKTLSEALSILPVSGNVLVPQGSCGGQYTIPADHSTTGVANADYVLYVAAAPTSGTTLAFASGCRKDSNDRFIVGRANFGPKYISSAAVNKSSQVATAMHELVHALGFSSSQFTGKLATETRRGKSASVLQLPNLAEDVRTFLGCTDSSAVTGAEIEDEGGSGSQGSHFERRLFKNELMAASGGETLSRLTLRALQQLQNYTVDFSKGTAMSFGRGAGCSYATEKCSTTGGGKDTFFCFDKNDKDECTANFDAVGFCDVRTFTSALPTAFQYFASPLEGGPTFMDGCPFINGYSNRFCAEDKEASDTEKNLGFAYGSGSRCFATTGLVDSGFSSPSTKARCLVSRCVDGYVQVKVGSNGYETCIRDGDTMGFGGFNGAVVCPARATFCAAVNPPGFGEAATPAKTFDLSGLDALPSGGSREQVRGIITFSGTNWAAVLAAKRAEVVTAVKFSIGILFDIATSDVEIDGIQSGSLIVDYDITSRFGEGTVYGRFDEAVTKSAVTAWYDPLTDVYASVSGSTDTFRPTKHETKETYRLCEFAGVEDDQCIYILVGAGVFILLLIALFVYCCCCRKSEEEKAAEASRKREPMQANAQPRRTSSPHGAKGHVRK